MIFENKKWIFLVEFEMVRHGGGYDPADLERSLVGANSCTTVLKIHSPLVGSKEHVRSYE